MLSTYVAACRILGIKLNTGLNSLSQPSDSYIIPARGALSGGVRRLADGQTVVENQASVLTRLRTTIAGRMPATEFSSVALSF